ncbi:ABC transporter permease [Phytoactinopolyspora alkaliphila]|uniref:ABC transporter permease n=1 Tax=Phytoactinopolyspora alkaliphila TaxID=1783498 RepID=A0A6N9YSC5_9ACTN|nr:ABC transporter permease [Phytoactinopolyspora alkaliphila]NED97882.1 ABC transporter permease [Phytoactinopolyspora alkaliphila]
MLRFMARRLVRLTLSLVVVSIITFGLLQLVPGSFSDLADVGSTALGDQASSDDGGLAGRYGDEVPAWEQYATFMRGLATWDMGPTYKYPQTTVEELIGEAFPVSLSLAVPATLLTLLVAIPIGMLAAVKKDKLADYGSIFTLTTIQALPGYLFALVLVLIFSVGFGWLPVRGWNGPEYMIIPVVALAVQPTAMLARYVRSSMLEALRDEYVVAALAKGGTKRVVLVRHVLRNSLIPLVTVVGPIFAALATGTVFVEVLLGIPGLGRLFTLAARTRDMPLLMGTTLFFALVLMVMNLIVDLAYGLLDPRIRHQQRADSRWRRPKRPRMLRGSPVLGNNTDHDGGGGGSPAAGSPDAATSMGARG